MYQCSFRPAHEKFCTYNICIKSLFNPYKPSILFVGHIQTASHQGLHCLLKADTLFFQNQSHLFIRYAQFFHFMLFLRSEIVFYGVQKLKGKHVFRRIEIIHVRLIISSIAQKGNSVDFRDSSCKLAMLSKVTYPIKNPEPQALR